VPGPIPTTVPRNTTVPRSYPKILGGLTLASPKKFLSRVLLLKLSLVLPMTFEQKISITAMSGEDLESKNL
jgi:hypothetical protein